MYIVCFALTLQFTLRFTIVVYFSNIVIRANC